MIITVILLTSASASLVIVVVLLSLYVKWYFSPLRQLPGPSNRGSILGNFPEIRREPFMEPHKRWWKDAGMDARAIHYTMSFWNPSLLVLDKDIIRTILTSPYGKEKTRFRKITRMLSDLLGDGLVTLQGPDWMRHRRMLQPSFSTSFLRDSLNQSVPSKVNRFVQCWERGTKLIEDREIELNSHLSALTLDIIGDVAFSHNFNALDSLEEWSNDQYQNREQGDKDIQEDDDKLAAIGDPLVNHFTNTLRINYITIICSLTGLIYINRYINPQLRRGRYFLDKEVDRVVANAKKENTKCKSILQLMLHAQDQETKDDSNNDRLSDTELRDEVKTFIVAGHETTSTWIYWALYTMAIYPDVQTRLFEDVIKHAPAAVEEILMEQVEKMDYLNVFLLEVLRLYPPAGFFSRVNTHEENFDGIIIPAGTRISISPHLMHRHPKYWDDPEDFKPERWYDNSDEELEHRRFAFLPFSTGGRGCIGQQFATMEAKLILAPLVRAFRVAIAPSQRSTEFKFATSVTMKTKPRLKICLKKR
ncbi:hypothetical protein ACA910_013626 [Epithemia clementina (nom. ined.)]